LVLKNAVVQRLRERRRQRHGAQGQMPQCVAPRVVQHESDAAVLGPQVAQDGKDGAQEDGQAGVAGDDVQAHEQQAAWPRRQLRVVVVQQREADVVEAADAGEHGEPKVVDAFRLQRRHRTLQSQRAHASDPSASRHTARSARTYDMSTA